MSEEKYIEIYGLEEFTKWLSENDVTVIYDKLQVYNYINPVYGLYAVFYEENGNEVQQETVQKVSKETSQTVSKEGVSTVPVNERTPDWPTIEDHLKDVENARKELTKEEFLVVDKSHRDWLSDYANDELGVEVDRRKSFKNMTLQLKAHYKKREVS